MTVLTPMAARCVVLISGSGSNLQALIDAQASGHLRGALAAVISNRADAGGLVRAKQAGIPTAVLGHGDFPDRERYDHALAALIDRYSPDLVVLAGFMRILSEGFVARYHGRLLNIHPSLLPDFKGLNTHQRALEAGCEWHGCSVHFVSAELDGGPVVAQARLAVEPGETPAQLAARVLRLEHRIYPRCVSLFLEGRLRLGEDGMPALDGKVLPKGLLDCDPCDD